MGLRNKKHAFKTDQ